MLNPQNMINMNLCTSTNSKALLNSCEVKLFTLTVLFLTIQISCTHVNKCQHLRKGKWECEGNYFIPTFPPDTNTISFTDLNVVHLDNKTFQNLTELHLIRLLIKFSGFKNSSTGVFSYLKYLKQFEMIDCTIQLSVLRNMFLGLPVSTCYIVLVGIDLQRSNRDLFEGIRRTDVYKMVIWFCNLGTFNGDHFTGMNRLTLLDISKNSITSISSWGYLPNLNFLDLYNNKLSSLKPFKNATGFSFYPKLEKLFLEITNCQFLDSTFFPGLNQLHTIGLYVGDIHVFKSNVFQGIKNLRAISLSSRKHRLVRFETNVFNIKYLDSLELENIHIMFHGRNQSESLFQPCTQLTNLILRNITSRMAFNTLLKPLTKLENLEISHGILSVVPDTICYMPNLRTLTIHETTVTKWDNVKCPVMSSLRKLVLKSNKIRFVNESLFSKLLFSNEKLKIDISLNPFVCDCNILWFRDWVNRNADRVLHYRYCRCFSPGALQHTSLKNFTLSWEYCENRHKPSTIALAGIIVATLSVIFVLTGIVSYTKRWSIRFCIYQAIVRRRKYKTLVNDGQYKYDAFVCYCSADINWVLNKMLPVIEEENHFHLCLHDRDFLVGNDIVDNIVDSMQQSRKVVLVLSDHFAQSSWCQFEASIAQQKILEEHNDIIIPILLNEIPANLQTKRLSVLLKQKTYLEWPNENQYEEMFWNRFIVRLNEELLFNDI